MSLRMGLNPLIYPLATAMLPDDPMNLLFNISARLETVSIEARLKFFKGIQTRLKMTLAGFNILYGFLGTPDPEKAIPL